MKFKPYKFEQDKMTIEYSRDVALADLFSGNKEKICQSLVGIAFCDPEWQWSQNKFLEFLNSNDMEIRRVSATCLGHVARIHGQLDKEKVIAELEKHLCNDEISGTILDALDDINDFLEHTEDKKCTE